MLKHALKMAIRETGGMDLNSLTYFSTGRMNVSDEQKSKYQSQFAVQRNDFAIQMYITLMESWRMVISNAIRYKGQFYRYFGPPKSNKVKYHIEAR